MDALDRIEPVARGLLARVDAALIAHGAPADHPLWPELRRVGAAPGDAVAFFATVDPERLRCAAAALRDEAGRYAAARLPEGRDWQGSAGESFTARVSALSAHLGAGAGTAGASGGADLDPDSMGGRLHATASYVEEVADWCAGARAALARTLAEVLSSPQAVAVVSCPVLGGDVAEVATLAGTAIPRQALLAAADIGAHVLATAATARADGHDLLSRWSGRLAELTYHAPVEASTRLDTTIRLHH